MSPTDGRIAAIAVTQADSYEETNLSLVLRQGTGLSNASLSGRYNVVDLGIDDSDGPLAFSAGLAI